MDKLRLGVAGLGIGGGAALAGAERSPVTEIVAAADVRTSALDAFKKRYGGHLYERVEGSLRRPTPNQFHCPHVVMAAEHGKHIVGEKPMALSVAECEKMVEAAERNNVQLLCGHTYGMSPNVQALLTKGSTQRQVRPPGPDPRLEFLPLAAEPTGTRRVRPEPWWGGCLSARPPRRTASVVIFDRSGDCIRHGALQIGRASQAAGVQVTGEGSPALELFLKDAAGTPTYWAVPGVDDAHAPTVGRAIAEYLEVPLVTRVG